MKKIFLVLILGASVLNAGARNQKQMKAVKKVMTETKANKHPNTNAEIFDFNTKAKLNEIRAAIYGFNANGKVYNKRGC